MNALSLYATILTQPELVMLTVAIGTAIIAGRP